MSEPEATADRDYTTQQAADLCGISINTLLSWERRYGVPSPRRNERGERVYTPDDLAGIRWLQAETARGIPIGVAATRFLSPAASPAAEDVVVALDPARAVEGSFPARPSVSRASGQQTDLIATLMRFDRSAVSHLLGRFALESDPLLVAHAIILPAMRTLARRIEDGEANAATLDIGSHWIVGRLSAWLDAANPDRAEGRAVVLVLPPDTITGEVDGLVHAIGIARRGDHVLDLPRGTALETIVAVARAAAATRIEMLVGDDTPGNSLGHHAADARAALLRSLLPGVTVSLVLPDSAPLPAAWDAPNPSAVQPGDETAFPG